MYPFWMQWNRKTARFMKNRKHCGGITAKYSLHIKNLLAAVYKNNKISYFCTFAAK